MPAAPAEAEARRQGRRRAHREVPALQQAARMERFLAAVEAHAFQMARYALRDEDEALDAVQDAMLQLVRRYSRKPEQEWRPLFFRILQNRIRDLQRRRGVRNRVFAWFGRAGAQGEDRDVLAEAADPAGVTPERQVQLDDAMSAVRQAVGQLPPRQQQAFLLRTLEGMDVAETARAMGCSEGSVKTHYSRALGHLRAQLGEHW
jgi:RNA polymerase sigma-70 factor (ECF subfamily)